jgi:Tfp pilus assembly protein PilO
MSRPQRCRNWIIIAPIAAIAAAYVYFVFLPNRVAMAALGEQIRTKREVVAGADKARTSLHQATRDLEKANSYLSGCRRRIVAEKELAAVYGKIHRSANEVHVHLTRFDPQPAGTYEKIRRIPCFIGCTGAFGQIYEFLRKLESLQATAWVTSLRVEKMGKSDAPSATAQCDMVVEIFADNPDNSDYARHSN